MKSNTAGRLAPPEWIDSMSSTGSPSLRTNSSREGGSQDFSPANMWPQPNSSSARFSSPRRHRQGSFVGLLFGNLLAVLSWTFICAPIAVRTRLTLYWYLRKIAGPGLTSIYNVANAMLYCILAGAMIAVSATAVGLAFGLKTPPWTLSSASAAGSC